MIDFSLSEEERAVRDTIRQFIQQEVMPLEPQVLRNERHGLPPLEPGQLKDLQEKAKQGGWWGINTPEEYGGIALGPVMSVIVAMETGRTYVPFRFGGTADNILYAGTAEQKQQYLIPTINGERRSCFAITEPGAGSDARNIRTRAVKDGGVTCFLVDRDMGWKSEPIPTMGEWGPASLVFEDVRVPERNILGELGHGFKLAMQWIGNGRYMIPAGAIGAAERMLGMAIEHAKNRVSMGHPIADYQAIQWQIADSHVEIESVKWLTLHAAWQLQNGIDNRHASSIAKLSGAIMANQVVDRVLQNHGGMGYTKELPIERWYRELRLLRIFEGTDEIQRRTIARNLLKGHVKLGQIGD